VRVSTDLLEQWVPDYEQVANDSYPDDVNAIGAELASLTLPPSLERLTPDAMDVVDLAREEAHSRSHAAVGTGHILLALLRRRAPTGTGGLGIPVAAVESALDMETRTAQPSASPPLTPRSFQVLMRAERRAASRPDPRATPDDILAALLDETGGLAGRVMNDLAVDRDAVRAILASP
jgi:ATP-dependent Clp protease ATP-binding subunit ClpA